jgi:FkbM family methyltransferase
LAAGVPLGVLGRSLFDRGRGSTGPSSPQPVFPVARGTRRPEQAPPAEAARLGLESFSQSGEDLIVRFICAILGIGDITYLDVGANDPIELNNTYFFYLKGYRGVLVEPNVSLCEKLRKIRPEDTTLVAGIGVTEAAAADYYIMTYDGLNTFSKEEAEHQTKVSNGRVTVKEVIKMPLLNINKVMEEHFGEAPTVLSVDTEGLDLAILKSIDYKRFRPKIICAETLVYGTTKIITEIADFMSSQGYVVRGASFVNTVFVDAKIL